jgi:hypothetical protein
MFLAGAIGLLWPGMGGWMRVSSLGLRAGMRLFGNSQHRKATASGNKGSAGPTIRPEEWGTHLNLTVLEPSSISSHNLVEI